MGGGFGEDRGEGGLLFSSLSGILSYVLRQMPHSEINVPCASVSSIFKGDGDSNLLGLLCKDYLWVNPDMVPDQSLAQSERLYKLIIVQGAHELREVIRHGGDFLAVKVQVTLRQTLGDVRRVKSNGRLQRWIFSQDNPGPWAGLPARCTCLSKEPRSLHTCLWIWARVFSALICSSGNSFIYSFLLKFSWLTRDYVQ